MMPGMRDAYLFIGYEKSIDKVRHEKLFDILKQDQVDTVNIRIIQNLYQDQQTCVRLDGKSTREINIQHGVRLGCLLSSLLFNM